MILPSMILLAWLSVSGRCDWNLVLPIFLSRIFLSASRSIAALPRWVHPWLSLTRRKKSFIDFQALTKL
jgi:hypothetical protein